MGSRSTRPPQGSGALRRWTRRGLIAAGLLVLAPLLYVAAGFGLAWIPVNTAFHPDLRGVRIAVLHNGVHADLVLPLQTAQMDWWDLLSPDDFVQDTTAYGYAAFGWGNRAFYLETPTWNDVRVATVLRVLLGCGGSALHVDLWQHLPAPGPQCRHTWVSQAQYGRLVASVRRSFALTDGGRARSIPGARYFATDAFYEAEGHYHLFRTCNVWTGGALRDAGVRVGWWTPFARSVFLQLPDDAAHDAARAGRRSSEAPLVIADAELRRCAPPIPALQSPLHSRSDDRRPVAGSAAPAARAPGGRRPDAGRWQVAQPCHSPKP